MGKSPGFTDLTKSGTAASIKQSKGDETTVSHTLEPTHSPLMQVALQALTSKM